MSVVTKLPAVALLAAAATFLPGCAGETWCLTERDGDIGSTLQLAEGGGSSNLGLTVVENLVWWPYKLVTSPFVGAVQGGVGWYEVAGEPVSATLTLPVGVALGLIHGTVNGIGQEPLWVERDDDLVEVLKNPFITDHEVWKDTTPPFGRPSFLPPGGEGPPRR